MRLSSHQLEAIKQVFHKHFLKMDTLWLFGSRVDALKKGGDIDLYIETEYPTITIIVEKKSIF